MLLAKKIALIQHIFQEAKTIALNENDHAKINASIHAFQGPYYAVAQEGVSMALAIKELTTRDQLEDWCEWKNNFGAKYISQIHVGLGWALSELKKIASIDQFGLPPSLRWRTIDGYGYHQGLFNRRSAVRNQNYDSFLKGEDVFAYFQGLGRSFWYISKGNQGRLSMMVSLFPNESQAHLWRGIGLASAYVGGLAESDFTNLRRSAAPFEASICCGVLLADFGRKESDQEHADTTILSHTCSPHPEQLFSYFLKETDSFLSSLQTVEELLAHPN